MRLELLIKIMQRAHRIYFGNFSSVNFFILFFSIKNWRNQRMHFHARKRHACKLKFNTQLTYILICYDYGIWLIDMNENWSTWIYGIQDHTILRVNAVDVSERLFDSSSTQSRLWNWLSEPNPNSWFFFFNAWNASAKCTMNE